MHERYIAISGGLYGSWGAGETPEDAKAKLRKFKGKTKGCTVLRFTSELPFAPATKKVADPMEADCWIGQDGSVNWIRCEKTEVK